MIKQYRLKTDGELANIIMNSKQRLLEMRFKIANGDTEGVHLLKEVRKTIANAMTVLAERDIKIAFTTNCIQLITVKDNKQVFTTYPITIKQKETSETKVSKFAKLTKNKNKQEIEQETNVKTESIKFEKQDHKIVKTQLKNKPTSKQMPNKTIKQTGKKGK